MAKIILCILVCCWTDTSNKLSRNEHVDLLEFNHFYDENGKHVFDQVIMWDTTEHDELHVREWILYPGSIRLTLNPGQRRIRVWHDYCIVTVSALTWSETWTQYDPELFDRSMFDKEARRPVTGK